MLRVVVQTDSYTPTQAIELSGVEFVQMPATIDEVAALSGFDAGRFVETSPDVVRFWPALSPRAVVFRFEPLAFTGVAGYVVARSVGLVTG